MTMTSAKLQPKGYDYILDNLRQHKEKVDRAIQALEALRDSPLPATDLMGKSVDIQHNETEVYSGMHFLDAARILFGKAKGALTTSQITEALLSGGFSSESEHPKKVIAAQLHRYADNGESGITKAARGLWAMDQAIYRRSP